MFVFWSSVCSEKTLNSRQIRSSCMAWTVASVPFSFLGEYGPTKTRVNSRADFFLQRRGVCLAWQIGISLEGAKERDDGVRKRGVCARKVQAHNNKQPIKRNRKK